jgi:tetrapyrrole methylase family protein/MazG family protein
MTPRPRVVVVGLGPAGPELIDGATDEALASIDHRFLRTRRHPAADVVRDATAFDDIYDAAESLDEVYPAIVERLIEAAQAQGVVAYAVPGSPLVAERSVELLRADARVDVEIRPALSFLDLAWNRLGIDPIAAGVRLVDGQRFAVEAAGERGPMLVAQCDSRAVLSDVKLWLEGDTEVTVLQGLGTTAEHVAVVPWPDLDRVVQPDHLTTLWLPELAAPIAQEVARFAELVAVLRRECPWDREQTHESLMRHLVEETYEVLDAIEALDVDQATGYEHLEEELGDLLFQVVFHATLAAEAGQFTLADVATTVHDKLRHRHPHVFGDVAVDDADDVMRNWEQIKKAEKGRASVFDGIPTSLPALLLATKVLKKADTLADDGIPVPQPRSLAELTAHVADEPDLDAVGELLFATVELARRAGVDPERALRTTTRAYREQVAAAEQSAG